MTPWPDILAELQSRGVDDEEIEKVKAEAPEAATMAQWALAWCLKHPAVSCVIPGCKSVEQVVSNAAAAGLEMVSEDHRQAVA